MCQCWKWVRSVSIAILAIIMILISYILANSCTNTVGGLIFDIFCVYFQDTPNIAKVSNIASSAWGHVFPLLAAQYFCRPRHYFFITCNELTLLMDFSVQVDDLIENFPDYFCSHLYQIYVPTVDSIVSIFAFYFLILHFYSQDSIWLFCGAFL